MVIGIDVGMSGAICFKNGEDFEIIKMPVIEIENSAYKHWYDVKKILESFNSKPKASKVFIEYQRPLPGQRIDSLFRLGRGFGLLEGLTSSIFSSVTIVDPKKWQHYLYKKYMTKEESSIFDLDTGILSATMEEKYSKIFDKKRSLKSIKSTKLKTFYCLYKTGYMESFSDKELKDHDKIDSFMIALYGDEIS